MICRARLCGLSRAIAAISDLPRGLLLPMIEVRTATERDFEIRAQAYAAGAPDTADFCGDCSDLSTFIWWYRAGGQAGARRIARDLERDGFAVVYPYDAVLIEGGRMHQIIQVGTAIWASAGHDADDEVGDDR